jgi:hypothetical protein
MAPTAIALRMFDLLTETTLYNLRVSGRRTDAVRRRSGGRAARVQQGEEVLNHELTYLNHALDWG